MERTDDVSQETPQDLFIVLMEAAGRSTKHSLYFNDAHQR